MRFSYIGSEFNGYQSQRHSDPNSLSVQDIIEAVVKRNTVVAGRTDKSVSAISQVVGFSTSIPDVSEYVKGEFEHLKRFANGLESAYNRPIEVLKESIPNRVQDKCDVDSSESVSAKVNDSTVTSSSNSIKSSNGSSPRPRSRYSLEGVSKERLRAALKSVALHECARVPRSFNARSTALWRRYMYVVPLSVLQSSPGVHVDLQRVGVILQRCVAHVRPPSHSFANPQVYPRSA